MSPERDEAAMEDMLAYSREAVRAGQAHRRDDLDQDRFFYLGLQRLVEVIGEAASRVSHTTRERCAEVPWQLIVGMRNRLIHGYDVVDADALWDTVVLDLPPLIAQLESTLSAERGPGETDTP